MAVGFFPTDGVCVPEGRCWLDISKDVSAALHSIGAFGGVLALLFIIMTFWYIGHPLKSDYVPRMRWLSWIGVTLIGIATIMHFIGYRVATTGLLFGAGMTVGFAIFLFGMLYFAKRLQNGETVELSPKFWKLLNEPLWHGLLIVTIGLVAGRIWTNLITLVTLEFVILSLFSLFIYSYSLYTVELMDDAQDAEQRAWVKSSAGEVDIENQ